MEEVPSSPAMFDKECAVAFKVYAFSRGLEFGICVVVTTGLLGAGLG